MYLDGAFSHKIALPTNMDASDILPFLFNRHLDETRTSDFKTLFTDDLSGLGRPYVPMTYQVTAQWTTRCPGCRIFGNPHCGSKHPAMDGRACHFDFLRKDEE